MNKVRFLLTCFFYVVLGQGLLAQPELALKLEIMKALKEEGLTGAVWSIVDADGRIRVDAYGTRNEETGDKIRPDDRVHIGSITKTLIATGILKLASDGRVGLNDPVSRYVPHLAFENQWEATSPVTIRHLLDHTAGLTDVRLWQIFSEKADPDSPLEYVFTRDPAVLKVHSEPGKVFSYSNMGYTLLAMVIERLTNERYENYLDRELLMPLGMTNSSFQFVSQVGDKADKRLAFGHLDNQKLFPALPMYVRPAGQFTTTAYDMALFASFLLSDGKLHGKRFIDPDYLLSMGQAQHSIAKEKGLSVGYGLGAMTRDRHGQVGLAHSGNIVGFHAMLYWFPVEKKAFFIAHNMDSETADYERFNKILIGHLDLEPKMGQSPTATGEAVEKWEGYYLPLFSKIEPFGYADLLTGYTKLEVKGGSVVLSPFQQKEKRLYPAGGKLFIADGKTRSSHVLYEDGSGGTFFSDAFSSHQKVSGFTLFAHWTSFVFGCLGLLFLFISCIVQVARKRTRVVFDPVFPSCLAFVPILLSVPFFFGQSFVALGDRTPASLLLFVGTCMLPIGLVLSAGLFLRNGLQTWKAKLGFVSVLFALQWTIVLCIWGLIPCRLWV